MKKHYLNILVLILCLFFSSGKIFSQQTPLLYYSFDKYDSEYVYDESGKENMKGSIHGNSYAWDKGFFGNAFVFSDSQDYIKLPDNINAGMKDFTIGCWVYGDKSFSSWSRIWDIGNGTNNYMFLSPKSGANTLRFAFKKDASSGEEIIEAGFSLYEEMWMHVIVTVKYDDNNIGYGKLYINGNLFGANDNITVTPEMLGLTTSNYIAKSQFAGDPALGGKIDEFVICDYAMEYSEVETLYHNGLPANLFNVYSIFTYSDFSSITTDLDLFTSYDDVNVEWTSSDESVISTSGVVTRDKIHEKDVILTATMTYTDENNQTYSISKTIEA